MSNRNSQANKQAARERLRAEREAQAKKDKMRRQLTVGASILVVLAVAGGIGFALSNMNSGSKNVKVSNADWKADAKAKTFVKPANTSGDKGTTVIIGDKNAKNTLQVFEDMRCPVCAQFEQASGEALQKGIKDGTYKAQFTMGAFLDDNKQISGSGSKNALSALGAALDVSPDAFLEYKEALFSAENHPAEDDDQYSDDEKLIDIAQDVKALKGNKAFEKAVKNGTYDKWALAMGDAFNEVKDIRGTPNFKVNGKLIKLDSFAPEAFTAAVDKELKK
ncbi:thioredoxin domain-containing protein [Streptomyces sp. P1-3]|uniref:thioredoxin domain-containing protein n=1 Tax=Streptomyces sp. P1-3 TaxID=3421658 RepID=UPI003D35FF5A